MSIILSLAALAVIADTPRCATIAIEPSVVCVDAPGGVIVSDNPVTAAQFLDVMREGEARFRRHFGVDPTPYGLIVGEGVNPVVNGVAGAASSDLQDALSAAGATAVLPWLTDEQMGRVIRDGRRTRIEAEVRAEGLAGAALEQAVNQRLDAMPTVSAAERRAAAAHEFGHLWLIRSYWPTHGGMTAHYGGPAPDWFDESAAVLMEDDAMAASRRRLFGEAWGQAGGARPKPLGAYFVDPHPLVASGASQIRVPMSSGPPSSTLTPEEAAARGARPISELPPGGRLRTADGREVSLADLPPGAVMMPASPDGPAAPRSITMTTPDNAISPEQRETLSMFYAQARVLADFLFERSGDEQVYGRIARAYADGLTLDQWLANEGPSLRLPASVADLDAAWNGWLIQTYGPAG